MDHEILICLYYILICNYYYLIFRQIHFCIVVTLASVVVWGAPGGLGNSTHHRCHRQSLSAVLGALRAAIIYVVGWFKNVGVPLNWIL